MAGQQEDQEAIAKLRERIQRLTDEQTQALKHATYVGMTAEEAKAYDARRATITRLLQELADLKKASSEA